MKKLFIIPFCLLFSLSIFSQTKFYEGYFIKKSGEKVVCLIKDEDWNRSPILIKYKTNEELKQQEIKTDLIREFEIEGRVKYKQINTSIDVSKDKANIELSPVSLLAQVIVEGKASLFYFYEKDKPKYFYSVNDLEVNPLISKEYLLDGKKKYNNDFLVRLNSDVKCKAKSNFVRIKYNLSALKDYFLDYNLCKKTEISFVNREKKVRPGLKVHIGANLSNLDIELFFNRNDFIDKNLDFGNQLSPTFGLEGEFILPISNNKFSANISLFYRNYESETFNNKTSEDFTVNIESVQTNIGFRYLLYLNEQSKFSIGPDFSFDLIELDDEFTLTEESVDSQELFGGLISFPPMISVVIGFEYDKFGVQARYFPRTDISEQKGIASLNYNSFFLTGTYRIF